MKCREVSSAAERGWFVQLPIIGGLNEPPRPLHQRWLRDIFLDVAATPPLPRRGLHSPARFRLRPWLHLSPLRGLQPWLHSCPATRLFPFNEAAHGLGLLYSNRVVLHEAVQRIEEVMFCNYRSVLSQLGSPIVDRTPVDGSTARIDCEYLRCFRRPKEVREFEIA